jgi:D-alanyl-D-alanine carboxypeptidase
MLSLVVEQATGVPWSEAVRQRVQLPRDAVDMYVGRTYQRQPLDVAHVTPPPGEPGGGFFMESLAGAGAWMGTPVDMVRILDGLDPSKPGADLLSAASLSAMRARPSTDPGDESIWYGLGLVSYRSGLAWGHTGALMGSRTMMVHEANGVTWCIMVNARFADHSDVLLALMDRAMAKVGQWPAYDLGADLP